jgi:branched-chain amino acid transport system permease protein
MSGGISTQALLQQLLLGLINGSFYALLSLGLAIIFGLLGVINFAHGAFYMLGAFVGWGLLHYAGIGYWGALVLAPLAVGLVGVVIERGLLRRLYRLDPLYNLLLTFGLALILQGLFQLEFGSSGEPYAIPEALDRLGDNSIAPAPLLARLAGEGKGFGSLAAEA